MSLSSIFLPSGVSFESKASVYDLICCQTTAVETIPRQYIMLHPYYTNA